MALVVTTQLSAETADELECAATGSGFALNRATDGNTLQVHTTLAQCEQVRLAAHGGVACVWFTPDMPVGPGGWNETGWRPMNVATKIGLGRRPVASIEICLQVSAAAAGGMVCTNTGVGYKSANIDTNMWCGASSQLSYCLEASRNAVDFNVCSFPSDGTGAEPGWVPTRVSTTCEYLGAKRSLAACNASLGPDL